MSSPFDDAFAAADDILFDVFGEQDPAQYFAPGAATAQPVNVVLHRNMGMVGADGMFMVVQHAADLRLSQVAKPIRGAVLVIDCQRYVLEDAVYTDALIHRFSLNPQA